MPAYNSAEYIIEAIESVKNQTYKNWELIVINDGSTDNTASIVEKLSLDDSRIRLVNQENKRLGGARNTGLINSKGDWIAFLDSDDLWLPEKLEKQLLVASIFPEADVIFSNGYSSFEGIEVNQYYHFPVYNGLFEGKKMYQKELFANGIPVLSVITKKEWTEKIGLQDESELAYGSEDWDYWLRLSKAGANFYGMSDRLFIYRVHSGGMSSKLLTQQKGSIYILGKNFDENIASSIEAQNIDNMALSILPLLFREKPKDANAIFELLKSKGLLKLHDSLKELIQKDRSRKIVKINFLNKAVIKNIALSLVEIFYFSLYKKFLKHAHLLNKQYHIWLYKSKINIKGYFYIHPTSTISINGDDSTLTTFGLTIYGNTQLNISGGGKIETGKDVIINRFCNFNVWNGKLLIGNNVLFNNYCSVNCMDQISIGDNTWFGEGVRIYDHNHKFKEKGRPFTEQGMVTGKVKIGRNVWIGSNTVILQNVTIGDNCVIGAGNVVYKSLSPNSIIKATSMQNIELINYA